MSDTSHKPDPCAISVNTANRPLCYTCDFLQALSDLRGGEAQCVRACEVVWVEQTDGA